MASNLNFETGMNCTSPRGSQNRRDVQPRQLAHRCLQRTRPGRFLASPLDGASSGPHGPRRFFHCTAFLLGTAGLTVGGIFTDVIKLQGDFKKDSVPKETVWERSLRSQLCEVLLTRSNHFTQRVSLFSSLRRVQ
jgi:hypothetical protein